MTDERDHLLNIAGMTGHAGCREAVVHFLKCRTCERV